MILECKEGGNFKPHPEGIHPAVCVDLIDLGLMRTDVKGEVKMLHKLMLVFESEQVNESDGRNCTISSRFTASLHPKSNLAEFISKWRGRPVVDGESIDLSKLIGASCTLVISHQLNRAGKTYGSIDAVSKPTKKLVPSGTYDPAAERERVFEWLANQGGAAQPKAVAPAQRPPAARLAQPQCSLERQAPRPAQPAAPDPWLPQAEKAAATPPAPAPVNEDDVPF